MYLFPHLPPTPAPYVLVRTHQMITCLCMHVLTEEKYHREVVVIPVDFSDGLEIYPNIAEQLKDLDIGILSKLVARKQYP